jgi:hypothetical protein
MSDEYQDYFSQAFQLKLLALLARQPRTSLDIIEPNYFATQIHAHIAGVIHNTYKNQNLAKVRLTRSTLSELVRNSLKKSKYSEHKREYLRTTRELFAINLSDREILIEQAKSFAKHARYTEALVNAEKRIHAGDYQGAQKVFRDLESPGKSSYSSTRRRQAYL